MKNKCFLFMLIFFLYGNISVQAYTSESDISKLKDNVNNLSKDMFLESHPIGSIYKTTASDENTAAKMAEKYGGTWSVFGENRYLKSSTGTAGQTGGSNTHTLTVSEMPNHSHTYTPSGTVSGTFSGTKTASAKNTTLLALSSYSITAANTSLTGYVTMHNAASYTNVHLVDGIISSTYTNASSFSVYGIQTLGANSIRKMNFDLSHSHGVTGTASLNNVTHNHTIKPTGNITSKFTGTRSTTGAKGSTSPTSISVENQYITVYVYKRVS